MKRKGTHGFTFVELLVVMIIILILATFAYPVFVSMQERAKIAQDMNNLRQLGFATQRYLTDADGVFFSNSGNSWMKRLCPGPTAGTQYLTDWGVFQAPWDTRSRGNSDATTPISYGVNNYTNAIGVDTSRILDPVAFIFFASAQASGSTVTFQGTAATSAPGVWVNKATSNPGGMASGGTQQRRKRITVVCADGHADNLLWSMFINDKTNASDPNGSCRWNYLCSP